MLSFGCYLNRLLFVQRVMLVVNPSRAGQPARHSNAQREMLEG